MFFFFNFNEDVQDAIRIVKESVYAYCHYITPNDVGATGGHQCGFTFSKQFYKMFFKEPGVKGENKDVNVSIKWQCDFTTESRAIYYGKGTRNEYRITRFGRDFDYLKVDYIGSLLIMTRNEGGEYNAYVLANQDNIEIFISTFNLDISLGNQEIRLDSTFDPEAQISSEFRMFIDLHSDFPDTQTMATFARACVSSAKRYTNDIIVNNSDSVILEWLAAEFELFRGLEEKIYRPRYTRPFINCQELVDFSNTILNRRKSRAGKSLELHLAQVFKAAKLKFEEQVITEHKEKPDFIFPDGEAYHNIFFPTEKLIMLGAKTTCKDRWRQILAEADRIDNKHLFTLQCGVSPNQLKEMKDAHLTLVVPKENRKLFVPEFHDIIMSLSDFIVMVQEKQNIL